MRRAVTRVGCLSVAVEGNRVCEGGDRAKKIRSAKPDAGVPDRLGVLFQLGSVSKPQGSPKSRSGGLT